MKNIFKSFLVLSCLNIIPIANATVDAGLGASSLKIQMYKFSVSTSPLCTNPITVVDNGNTPVEVDMVANPDLGSGVLTDGTYPCVIIEFVNVIKFNPSANSTSGNCLAASQSTLQICRSQTSVLADGTTSTCPASGAVRIAMYLSTASTSTNNTDAFNPPTSIGDAAHGFNLAAALVTSGSSSGKFSVNPAGKVCDYNTTTNGNSTCNGSTLNTCQLQPPVFSFIKQ